MSKFVDIQGDISSTIPILINTSITSFAYSHERLCCEPKIYLSFNALNMTDDMIFFLSVFVLNSEYRVNTVSFTYLIDKVCFINR